MSATLTFTETAEPLGEGVNGHFRTWWAADGPRMLALSVLHYSNGRPERFSFSMLPSVDTAQGTYTFDAFYSHEPSSYDGCRFHDGCEPSALSNTAFSNAWARIAAAEVTEQAVHAELERLHADVFGAETVRGR